MSRQPSIFSREEWHTIPYQKYPQTTSDKIKDILHQVPILLSRLDVLSSSTAISWQAAEKANVENDTRGILIQLNSFEETLKNDCYPVDVDTVLKYDFTNASPPTQDPTTPMAIAYHRTAKILCLYILSCFHASPEEELRVYCTRTLRFAEGLFDGDVLHPAYWRQVLLLKIVAFAVPGNYEKKIAWAILEGWAGKTGLCGIKMRGQSPSWDVEIASILSRTKTP